MLRDNSGRRVSFIVRSILSILPKFGVFQPNHNCPPILTYRGTDQQVLASFDTLKRSLHASLHRQARMKLEM
eukprot:217651-Amphidinium_carterae.4